MLEICLTRALVTSIDSQGFWLGWRDEELYLPFALFPWFEHATVAQLCMVQCVVESCLYWPELDLELGLEQIRNPMTVTQF